MVIELKKGQSSDKSIGQLTRYMGWVEEEKKDKNIKVIIVSASFEICGAF